MAETRTLTIDANLPGLVIHYPTCGHCGDDVSIEGDTAWCDNCRITWDDIREDCTAKPDEDHEGTDVPCEIVAGEQMKPHDDARGRHYVPGPPKPCILPSGHEGDHRNPYDVEVTG